MWFDLECEFTLNDIMNFYSRHAGTSDAILLLFQAVLRIRMTFLIYVYVQEKRSLSDFVKCMFLVLLRMLYHTGTYIWYDILGIQIQCQKWKSVIMRSDSNKDL